MYYDYDEFENYYEPTPADEIFNEAMEKFKETLKDNVKENLKYIQEENKRLKRENDELKQKERQIRDRELTLEMREKDLESKSEWSFYRKKFSEILKPLEEQLDLWYVRSLSELIPKCDLCDDDRRVEFVSGSGKKIKGDCECKKYHTIYKIEHTKIKELNFYKSDRDRKFVLTPKYESQSYDDSYFKLETQVLINNFEIDKVTEYKYYGSYGGFTGFATKEESQKYCDWLNENTKQKEDVVNKPKRKS